MGSPRVVKGFQIIILLACFGLFWGSTANAQNTSSLSGFIRDAKTGEALQGATVLVNGTQKGDATDENGYFKIQNISAKSYSVTASYVGYEPLTKYNVVIRSGGNPDITFELQPKVQELEGVTVVPNPYEKPPENPLSIQNLSQVQIASYPGGNNDIAKVVQSLPGVSGSVGGFRNDVIIRGGAPSENVYYLDGIEIPTINHFSTQGSAGGPVGLLNVSFFEGVTLSTSSFHARYDDVLSGVLQFDQRNGNASEYQANLRVGASEAALTVEGPLFKSEDEQYSNTTFIASVRRSYLQLLFQVIDLPFLPDYWDYQFKLNHKMDEYNELNLIGVGSLDDFSINKPDDITAEQQATLDQVPIIKQKSSTVGVGWKSRFKERDGYVHTTLRANVFTNDFSRYQDNENKTGLVQNLESTEWQTTLRSEYNRFIGDWTIAAGAMGEVVNYNTDSFRASDNVQFSTDLSYLQYGLFGQLTKEWSNGRFSTSLGIRADGNSFTNNGNKIWKTFSPRLAVSYALDPSERWSLNASVGRYYKLPANTILGFKRNDSFGNRNAEYIRSDHFVTGLSYRPRQSTQFSLEGFLKLYNQYPVSVTDSVSLANLGGDFEIFGNEDIRSVGEGRAYGMEFSVEQKLKKNLYGILAYTLYWAEFTGLGSDDYLPSVWNNRHLLTFTGGYKLPKNWEVGARLRILGGAPYPVLDEEASEEAYPQLVYVYSSLGSQRLGIFNSLDIRVDKKWNFKSWTFNLYLEVTNALASDIPSPPQYGLKRNQNGEPVQPREIVEIEEVDNTAILPTLGIVVDL